METNFYTYVYLDPRNGLPFYVGKGKGYRKYSHLRKAKKHIVSNGNGYLYRQIKEILSEGLEPIIKTVYNGSEDFALIMEEKLIANFKAENIKLCNLTSGGEGYTLSDESRKKCGICNIGRVHTNESKDKRRKAMLGRKCSTETKNKMRSSALNISKETKLKRSLSLKGRIFSDETRKKISNSKIGQVSPNRKLTDVDILKIHELINEGFEQKYISNLFNISRTTIYRISKGIYYKK